ncbi:MAG: monovalent cation/H+ antiporter subunit D family protein [Proteobacteria bacterium]|nr:monovalent cation/H+ antiporter subunit D family protein [Pseudomonadota bacterium]MBU1686927.1 monovalent cation/H+ antiporter subunit D family protein [Pseudomonadota bacterium]
MNQSGNLLIFILLSSLLPGLIIFSLPEKSHRIRTILNLGGALTKLSLILLMILGIYQGFYYEFRWTLFPGTDLVLNADPLSALFATLSAVLWLLTTIYAIGYLEQSPNRSRFFGYFSLCVSVTVGIALAGNLLTFLIFYEMLTLTTYPLVIHRGTPEAMAAGRVYLCYTLGGGAAFMAGVAWLTALVGPLNFHVDGLLLPVVETHRVSLTLIFILLIGGVGVKAALFPLHGWLPRAMVAPAPVSALLHAVAVVKAGVFGIIRIVHDIYSIDLASQLGLLFPLSLLTSLTILYGSWRALQEDDLKRRLAYSTISQVSYIALGISLAHPLAAMGGLVHLVHQGIMKITLFFCAGNLAETLGIHRISEMNGVARRMPLTMAAFSIGALGMIGLPPLAGFVSKWYLGLGALAADQGWVIVILITSTLLNALYFLPIVHHAWFSSQEHPWPTRKAGKLEAHWMLLLPSLITAFLVLIIGLLANSEMSPMAWARLIMNKESLQ